MNCDDVYRYLCENLDQGPDTEECRALKRHLEGCPDCMAYLDSLKTTIELYRTVPTPHIPDAVHQRLFKALETVTASHRKKKTGRHHKGC